MSQYISSFLIEPVVRQARRFSRPSTSDSHSEEPPPALAADQLSRYDHTFDENEDAGDAQKEPTNTIAEFLPLGEGLGGAVAESGRLGVHEAGAGEDGLRNEAEEPSGSRDIGRARAETEPQRGTFDTPNSASGVAERFRSANVSLPTSVNETSIRFGEGSGLSRRGTEQSMASINGASMPMAGDVTLPEDDGMSAMRRRILEIQSMEASTAEKSRLMLVIMTERYSSRLATTSPQLVRPHSPASMKSHDRPFTPSSCQSQNEALSTYSPHTSLSSVAADNLLDVTAEDLKPTYYIPRSRRPTSAGSSRGNTESRKQSRDETIEDKALGCAHYKRNVKLQCSSCHRWYTCRFCHDQVEDHSLNRPATKNMLCMLCGCAQPVGEECRDCGERGAWYYCGVCKLWDDDLSKKIYHCNDCGICRLGEGLGKDFFHCKVSICNSTSHPHSTNFCRHAVLAFQSQFETRIVASNVQLIATVPFVGTTCLHHHKPLSSCVVGTASIMSVIKSTCETLSNVRSVAGVSSIWKCRSDTSIVPSKTNQCQHNLGTRKPGFIVTTAVQSPRYRTIGSG